jgi:PAS domain S-box-containing protein
MTGSFTARIGALAAVYCTAALLGLRFAGFAHQVTPVWPATGIALVVLFTMGVRYWPGVALGAYVANLVVDAPPLTAAGIAAGNTLEAVVGVALLRGVGFQPSVDRLRDVYALVAYGAGASTAVSATIGSASLCAGGVQPWSAFPALWSVWWVGDALSDVVVAPLLFAWLTPAPRPAHTPRRTVEAIGIVAIGLAVGFVVFFEPFGRGAAVYPLHYGVFPVVIAAALRFGQRGATLATAGASAVAVWSTTQGWGPFAAGTPNERLVLLQLFMAVVAVTALVLGAAIMERDAAEAQHAADFERLGIGEQRLRLALEAGRMGVWDWNVRTGAVAWSENLEAIHGLPAGTFPGTFEGFQTLVHPDDRAVVERAIGAALAGGAYDLEFRTARPDGAVHWMATKATVLRDEQGHPLRMIGVGMEITERRRLAEELTARAQQLSEADRRKDEFLAMLAHELRNPLSSLATALHLLRLDRADHPRAVALAERQVKQLARLVDDLLDVSRITQGKIALRTETVTLADVVHRAVETTRPEIDVRGHTLTVTLPPGPILLEADPIRLAQVLANLLGNAAKYTPHGGAIAVIGEEQDHEVVIRVRDTGAGLSPDLLPRVFDLFVQGDTSLDRTPGGLGIGLTIVHRLVRLHGGRVEAYSDGPGRGSEFVVHLPTHRRRDAAGGGADGTPAVPVESARRVLVVEDNRDAAEGLATLLEAWGHEVRVAHDASAALDLLAAAPADVVVSDLGLPGIDGYELARRIRNGCADGGPVLVALSGYGQDEDRRRALQAGFDEHLVKPPDIDALARCLARAAARAQPGGPAASKTAGSR